MLFYKVSHIPREDTPGLPSMYAWLTDSQVWDPEKGETVTMWLDCNGQMVPEEVRLDDLEILQEDQ